MHFRGVYNPAATNWDPKRAILKNAELAKAVKHEILHASASTWRERVTEGLTGACECLSPLRGEMLSNGVYSATATDASAFNTQNAIIGRDRFDCCNSDLIFTNLLGAKKVSIGTKVELAWADASRKPVIVCMEASGNPHDSLHIRGLATYLVEDLESGIAVARCFFNAPQQPAELHEIESATDKALPEVSIVARHF